MEIIMNIFTGLAEGNRIFGEADQEAAENCCRHFAVLEGYFKSKSDFFTRFSNELPMEFNSATGPDLLKHATPLYDALVKQAFR